MADKSARPIPDQTTITAMGNQEERDAQVERIQERHERMHRVDATVDDAGGLPEFRPDAQQSSGDSGDH